MCYRAAQNILANLEEDRSYTVLYTGQLILALAGKYLTTNSLIISRFYPFQFENIVVSEQENIFLQNYSQSWQILCSFPSLQLFTEMLRLSYVT